MPRATSRTPIAPSGIATPQPATSPDSAGAARSVASGGMTRFVPRGLREAQVPPAASCENRGMDAIDREILGELVRNARISYRDLGARVGLSANAAAERVRRLRRAGVITGFTATLDPGAARARPPPRGPPAPPPPRAPGAPARRLHALVGVGMGAAAPNAPSEAAVAGLEAVTDADHVTGRFDSQPRVACHDTAELDRLLRHL